MTRFPEYDDKKENFSDKTWDFLVLKSHQRRLGNIQLIPYPRRLQQKTI